jgi:metacaspase-1
MVVIYLSSHGSPRESDTVGGLTYVITHDTEVASEDTLYGSALPMEYLAEVVRTRIHARRAAVFLDTCHSGGALTRAGATTQTLARLGEGVGRVIVASSQVKEQSYESPELGNGFFTYALLRALRGPGSSRPIAEVFSELRDQVAKLSRGRRNPVMSRSDEAANLVLGIEPKY